MMAGLIGLTGALGLKGYVEMTPEPLLVCHINFIVDEAVNVAQYATVNIEAPECPECKTGTLTTDVLAATSMPLILYQTYASSIRFVDPFVN
jgi:hypothetical protein